MDTLCESKYKVGLLGSMYFIGLVSCIIIVPLMADKCLGRRYTIMISVPFVIVS